MYFVSTVKRFERLEISTWVQNKLFLKRRSLLFRPIFLTESRHKNERKPILSRSWQQQIREADRIQSESDKKKTLKLRIFFSLF